MEQQALAYTNVSPVSSIDHKLSDTRNVQSDDEDQVLQGSRVLASHVCPNSYFRIVPQMLPWKS